MSNDDLLNHSLIQRVKGNLILNYLTSLNI